MSLLETLVVIAILGLLTAATGAIASAALGREEALVAARRAAASLRLLRAQSIAQAQVMALVFVRQPEGWTVARAEDGDGDGVRASDLASGVDPLREGPEPFVQRYGGAQPGFLPGIGTLRSPPPSSRPLPDLEDPVRFGQGDVISLTPRGAATAGTLYLTDGRYRQIALVVNGSTARVRTWEYDVGRRIWLPR